MKRILLTYLLILTSIISQSQEISRFGTSLIDNYTTQDYNSMSKNWMVSQDNNGLIYVANGSSLLEFDGEKWNNYNKSENSVEIIYSVNSIGSKVYIGYDDDFGYWEYNNLGEFVYTSLYPKQETRNHRFENFWNIIENVGLIYFQSNENIYIYKNNILTRISAPYKFNSLYKVEDKIYVEDNKFGLFEIKSHKLENVIDGNKFNNASICGVSNIDDNNSLLIVTKSHGLFKVKDGKSVEFITPSSEFLKKNMVFSFKRFSEKYLAFGTVLNGILITDLEGNPIQHLNKLNGLQNNTVLGIHADKDHNLWLALNNGVSRIKLNSPITHYTDYMGDIGTVYTTISHNNKLYLGTNQGLFYRDINTFENNLKDYNFKIIDQTAGQVWTLKVIDSILVCGHNKGTFAINDTIASRISLIRGGWNYIEVKDNPELIIGGNYDGIELFKKTDNSLKSLGLIKNYSESSRFLEFDRFGYFWISNTHKGVYRLRFNDDFTKVVDEMFFDIKDISKSLQSKIYMYKDNDNIYFSDGLNVYEYNIIKKTIEESTNILSKDKSFLHSNKLLEFSNFQIITYDNKINIYRKNQLDNDSILGCIYQGTSKTMGNEFENVNQIGEDFIVSGKVDGFTIFNSRISNTDNKKLNIGPLIREVFGINEFNNRKNLIGENLENINYEERLINFRFAHPSFDKVQVYNFYLLKDGDTLRSETNNSGIFVFRNNHFGSYSLLVNVESKEKSLSEYTKVDFHINKPIYLSNIFIVFYIVTLIVLITVLRTLYSKRIRKHKSDLEKLRQSSLKAQQDEFKKSEIEQLKTISNLEKQQLQTEVSNKSYQLANIAKNAAHRNEILETVKTKIISVNERSSIKIPKKYLNEILVFLESSIDKSETETIFEENFKAVNQTFYKKLIDEFPDLSSSDLKLAAFLKMNLSTKEIAEHLSITPKSLEVSRYRLRKKLQLERSDNLVSFLLNI